MLNNSSSLKENQNTQQQKSFKVLLIGDSCIDVFVYGVVKRLNPEAPVPVLNYTKKEYKGGMALNVLENLKAFGVEVELLTNNDKSIKTRYIDEKTNQQILRLDEDKLVEPLEYTEYAGFDAIVISDYNKGFISENFLFSITKNSSCPIFIDSKKTNLPTKNCFIKINDIEYEKLTSSNTNVIITRGGHGAEYNKTIYPAEKVKVYDVVGAGDTFLAALTYGYLKYGNIEKAIPLANKAAAVAVSNLGTYVLTKQDVENICN